VNTSPDSGTNPTHYMRVVYVSVFVFSALVCDLLPRRPGLFDGFCQRSIAEEYLSYNFDEQCLGGH